MLKWYADNTELSTDKGKINVLVYGGVIVNNSSEKKIEELLKEVKSKYTYHRLPVKWNFKDLADSYKEFKKESDYRKMLFSSNEWRSEIIEKSLNIDYKIILAATQRHLSEKPIKKIKEQLIGISFSQALMRVGLFAKNIPFAKNFEIILDWPESSNPKPFNREYFSAYNLGKSSKKVEYFSGPLHLLGFKDCVYFAKSTHSTILQFTDLVIGAAKDFIVRATSETEYQSLGYDLTVKLLPKYHGFPNNIIDYGLNFSPKNENYIKLKSNIDINLTSLNYHR